MTGPRSHSYNTRVPGFKPASLAPEPELLRPPAHCPHTPTSHGTSVQCDMSTSRRRAMVHPPVFPATLRRTSCMPVSQHPAQSLAQGGVWKASEQSNERRNTHLCVCVCVCARVRGIQEGVRGWEPVKECECEATNGAEFEGCVMGTECEHT